MSASNLYALYVHAMSASQYLNDRGQHSFCIICAEGSVEFWQLSRHWPCQHSQADVHLQAHDLSEYTYPLLRRAALQTVAHHLQVFGARSASYVAGLCPDVIYDWAIEPWYHEMCAFLVNLPCDAPQI